MYQHVAIGAHRISCHPRRLPGPTAHRLHRRPKSPRRIPPNRRQCRVSCGHRFHSQILAFDQYLLKLPARIPWTVPELRDRRLRALQLLPQLAIIPAWTFTTAILGTQTHGQRAIARSRHQRCAGAGGDEPSAARAIHAARRSRLCVCRSRLADRLRADHQPAVHRGGYDGSLWSSPGSERVLEIGAGSGYQAAVLGELAQSVLTIERHPALARTPPTRSSRWPTRMFAWSRATARWAVQQSAPSTASS